MKDRHSQGKSNRRRGIDYQCETAQWYLTQGFPDAKRGFQSRKGDEDPDVIVPGLSYWVECKRIRHDGLGLIGRAWEQAKVANLWRLPPVLHVKADRGDHLVVISREEWGRLIGKEAHATDV